MIPKKGDTEGMVKENCSLPSQEINSESEWEVHNIKFWRKSKT